MTEDTNSSPGETRTRQRQRRYITYVVISGIIGGIIGFMVGFYDEGDGNLFAGDIEALSLPPAIAVGLAIALIGTFLVYPLWGFFQIDDYQREHNLIAFTGGALSILSGFPVWAVLHAGDFLPPPTAHGLFAILFVSMILSFVYAKWRH